MTRSKVEEVVERLHDQPHCSECDDLHRWGKKRPCSLEEDIRAAVIAGIELAADVVGNTYPAGMTNYQEQLVAELRALIPEKRET